MSGRQVPQEAVKAAAEWLGGNEQWAAALLADAYPAIRLQVLEEVKAAFQRIANDLDEQARESSGETRRLRFTEGAVVREATLSVLATLSEEKTDEEGGSDG